MISSTSVHLNPNNSTNEPIKAPEINNVVMTSKIFTSARALPQQSRSLLLALAASVASF